MRHIRLHLLHSSDVSVLTRCVLPSLALPSDATRLLPWASSRKVTMREGDFLASSLSQLGQ